MCSVLSRVQCVVTQVTLRISPYPWRNSLSHCQEVSYSCLFVASSSVDFGINSHGNEMKVKGQGLMVKICTTTVASEII